MAYEPQLVRIRFAGTLEVPIETDAEFDDENTLAEAVQRAVTNVTPDDWAAAVEIEDTELVRGTEGARPPG